MTLAVSSGEKSEHVRLAQVNKSGKSSVAASSIEFAALRDNLVKKGRPSDMCLTMDSI